MKEYHHLQGMIHGRVHNSYGGAIRVFHKHTTLAIMPILTSQAKYYVKTKKSSKQCYSQWEENPGLS